MQISKLDGSFVIFTEGPATPPSPFVGEATAHRCFCTTSTAGDVYVKYFRVHAIVHTVHKSSASTLQYNTNTHRVWGAPKTFYCLVWKKCKTWGWFRTRIYSPYAQNKSKSKSKRQPEIPYAFVQTWQSILGVPHTTRNIISHPRLFKGAKFHQQKIARKVSFHYVISLFHAW